MKPISWIPIPCLLVSLFCYFSIVPAQQLKPTEIIYSRLPNNINQSPSGANQPTIWVVGQDGSNDRMITPGTFPRISDDGRFLLFKRFTRNPASFNPFGGFADLFIRELATGQETLIASANFDQGSFGHFFSPESNQGNYEIIFDDTCFMYKFDRSGANLFQFPWLNGVYCTDDFPVVRRGDQLIAFHNLVNDGVNAGLYTVAMNRTNRQKIPNTNCGDLNPAWSNDNQFIAYGSLFEACNGTFPLGAYPYFISNLWKIRSDGTGKQQLTNFSSGNCALAGTNCMTFGMVWNESNSRIIVAGRFNGTPGIYSIDAGGSAAFTQIPLTPGNAPDFVGGIVQPRVERQVTATAGGLSTTGSYSLVSTIGEPVAGLTSLGGSYNFASGFWALPGNRRPFFDYDGDGKTDISVFRPSSGAWYLLQSQAGLYGVGFGEATDRLAPADYDGDGRTDVAVYRPSNGVWYVLNSGNSTVSYFVFGAAEDLPTPADYDGDGKADLSVFRPSSRTWFRLNSSDNSFFAFQFGANGDRPALGDFDGDGRADISIYRPADGTWYRINSGNGSLSGTQFGASGDVHVPADFDGDTKTDLSVFRPSNGVWYRLNSGNGGFVGQQFGAAGDLPAPGDFDGDGKADVCVFRPSDGNWYRLNSSNNAFVAQPFGTAGDRPTPGAYQ